MEHGTWSMEHGAWSMEHGAWSMEHGTWRMENGIDEGCVRSAHARDMEYAKDGLYRSVDSAGAEINLPDANFLNHEMHT